MNPASTLGKAGLAGLMALTAVAVTPTFAAAQSTTYYGDRSYNYDPCRRATVGRSTTGGIVGALAGAAIGSNVAGHKVRKEGAVLGALAGAVVGSSIGRSSAACQSDPRQAYNTDNRDYGDAGYGYDDRYNGGYGSAGYNGGGYGGGYGGYNGGYNGGYGGGYSGGGNCCVNAGGGYGYGYNEGYGYQQRRTVVVRRYESDAGYGDDRYTVNQRPTSAGNCSLAESPIYLPDGRVQKRFVRVCEDSNGRYQVVD